jgi:hypothetical protein
MSIYDDVRAGLGFHLSAPITRESLIQTVPRGWIPLADELLTYTEQHGGVLTHAYVERGRLVIIGHDILDTGYNFTQRVAHGISGESARRSMLTSERAVRRKHIVGWPCLTAQQYLDYLNEAAYREPYNGGTSI